MPRTRQLGIPEWDGVVKERGTGKSRIAGYVEGKIVYQIVSGGPPRPIGYVEKGIAYERTAG